MPSKPIMERHCGFFTRGDEKTITLFKVTERLREGHGAKVEIDEIATLERTHEKAAALILLENAQTNILVDNLVITNPDDFYKIAACKEKDYWCNSCYKWYITNHAKCGSCGWEFLTSIEER